MPVERHTITSRSQWLEMRKRDVTASAVGALFNMHPYQTALALFNEKTSGEVVEIDNAVLRRGRLLEGAVAVAVEEKHPEWKLVKATEYFRDPSIRLGCTPDFFVEGDPRGLGVIQAKTVAPSVYKKAWADGPPFWISLQCAVEMMLTGAAWGAVAALVVDPWKMDCEVTPIPQHPGVEARIREATEKFWLDVEFGMPPEPNYARDGELIASLYPTEVTGKTIDLSGDNYLPAILAERATLKDQITAAQERIIEIDAEIKAKVGDAEIATMPDWTITLREQHRKAFEVKATSFRRLNVTDHRQKEDADHGPY